MLLLVYKYLLISEVLYQLIPYFPLNFPSTSSAVEIFSMGKMNQLLLLFLASCFFFISHSHSTSSTSPEHHCLPDQSHTLLQLRQEFVQKRMYNGSYPKMKSWKADSDCCSWDGVTCDPENGHVVGLNLTNSWLNGHLNS